MTGAEVCAALDLAVHCVYDVGMTMPEQQRAMAAEIVNIAIAVDIPFPRSLGARDVDAIRLDISGIVCNAARKVPGRLLGIGCGARGCSAVSSNDRRICRQNIGHTGDSLAGEASPLLGQTRLLRQTRKAASTGGLSKPINAANRGRGRRPQARTSRRAGILVTAADDRGLWLDTGSPPFRCCDEGW